MADAMIYRGFPALVERDLETAPIHGEIAYIDDVVTFQASSDSALEGEFRAAVDEYLAFCAENGLAPAEPPDREV
jgi:predicted HicB family RNase H-like nuclease